MRFKIIIPTETANNAIFQMENNVLEKEFKTLCQQMIFEAQKCTKKTRSSEINEHRGPNNDIRHPGHQTSRTSDI